MQEYFYQLEVKVSSHHGLFSDFLSDTIPVGFEEREDGFIIRSEDELDTIAWGLEQFNEALQKALGCTIDLEYNLTKEKNSDWVELFKQSVTPLEIDRFYIHPHWCEPKDDFINLKIDPSLAFGTGHHPTTASALKVISKYTKPNDKLLDVGCGSGILSIAAYKLGAVVDACDTDELSIANSKQNAQLNDILYNNIWVGSSNLAKDSYDIVVANIVADVLIFIANDLKKLLKPNAKLVLSGILDKYEQKVLKHYDEFQIIEKIELDEWVTLVLTRKEDARTK